MTDNGRKTIIEPDLPEVEPKPELPGKPNPEILPPETPRPAPQPPSRPGPTIPPSRDR
jgi:hypothetical protein